MFSYDLSYIGYAIVVLLFARLVWTLIGESVLKALYPADYAVWADTKPPRQTTVLDMIRFFYYAREHAKSGRDIFDQLHLVTEMNGDTHKQLGFLGYITLTSNPQNIQAMLATQFKDFTTGDLRRNWLFPALGDSIFTSQGSFWEHSRALFRPQFSRDNINNLQATDHAADALIAACGPTGSDGWTNEVALKPLCFNFTLDTATEFLFGESVNSQQAAVRKARGEVVDEKAEAVSISAQFLKAYDHVNLTTYWRTQMYTMYWLIDGPYYRAGIKVLRQFTEKFARLALDNPKLLEEGEGKQTNVLASLARQCKDPEELRNQTLSILFAGRDSTAALLLWTFSRLSLQPEIYAKLRKIVLDEIPEGEDITFAALKSCRYLQHVLNEVLRLHPVVPFNLREATRNTTLPTGGGADRKSPMAIRKGEVVFFSTYVMHRRSDLWGEDALEFKPERWEGRFASWQYLPFSGGPRICLGQQFALTEASYLLVKVIREFDRIEPVDRNEMAALRKYIAVTMSTKDPVRVRLHRAAR